MRQRTPYDIGLLITQAAINTDRGSLTYTLDIAGKHVEVTVNVRGPVILAEKRDITTPIVCPVDGCHVVCDEEDLAYQREHMESHHPEVIAGRLEEFHRRDGWTSD